MQYALAILSRYGAIGIQFIIVVLVARILNPIDAGAYLALFGLIGTSFTLFGAGIPDGLVKAVSTKVAQQSYGGITLGILRAGIVASALSLAAGCLAATTLIYIGYAPNIAMIMLVWWLAYGMTFFCAQSLVALHRAAVGSFFAYSAINIVYLVTSVPYLLFAAQPHLSGLLMSSAAASFFAACTSIVILKRSCPPNDGAKPFPLRPMWLPGISMACSRFLQASLAWLPVWVIAIGLGSADAALYGAAGRLVVGVTAVIASLRFAVRPAIVRNFVRDDWSAIESLSRGIAVASVVPTLIAIAAVYWAGDFLLSRLLGLAYEESSGILLVLLLGALAEAIAGPVDEILKMTGATRFVLGSLLIALTLEFVLSWALLRYGIQMVAVAPVVAFATMYFSQIVYLRRLRGILVYPDFGVIRRLRRSTAETVG
jgi:O-antigen/teichoic acid export membrane protein